MSQFIDLPWGLILIVPLIILVFSGKGKNILSVLGVSAHTFVLMVFLMIGGSLLSPWKIKMDHDVFINYGSIIIPLLLLIVFSIKLSKKERIRSIFAILIIGLYYFLVKGGYLWKIEEYVPEIVYLFAPIIALIAYLFCGYGRSIFTALIGGILIGDASLAILIGGTVFQEIFGLEIINLIFITLFLTAVYSSAVRLLKYIFKPRNKLDSLTNQD